MKRNGITDYGFCPLCWRSGCTRCDSDTHRMAETTEDLAPFMSGAVAKPIARKDHA